jgi:GTPase SAR1 family protein
MILVLCGNKIDLDDEQVTYSEAKRFAEKIQAELFLVSAKTG